MGVSPQDEIAWGDETFLGQKNVGYPQAAHLVVAGAALAGEAAQLGALLGRGDVPVGGEVVGH